MTQQVLAEARDNVLHVTMNVPERRNALSKDVLEQLGVVLGAVEDAGVRAVVLTGAGNFSAGADFADLTGTVADLGYDDLLAETTRAVGAVSVPVFAAIEGACIGAGLDLAMAADVRVAGESAWLQVPAVRLGLLYSPAAIARLHRSLPRETVTRLLVLAERFPAAAAHTAGLVSHVVADGSALERAHRLAAAVAGYPTDALRQTKALLGALDAGTVEDTHWQQVRERLLASPARRDAVAGAHARFSVHRTSEEPA